MESKDRVTSLVVDLVGGRWRNSPNVRQAETETGSQFSPHSPHSPHSLAENDPGRNAPLDLTREDHHKEGLARRFKVTLTGGKVLLHSAPSGLTRREAIELSKDWGEVAECVPCPPAEISEAQKSVSDTLIEACKGTRLGPDTFRALLDDDDLADIDAGLIPPRTLQAYAESFAKRLPTPPAGALVCCADCAHFERKITLTWAGVLKGTVGIGCGIWTDAGAMTSMKVRKNHVLNARSNFRDSGQGR
jgi:hypothetical protein